MWDDCIIAQRIRTMPNYTHPLATQFTSPIPSYNSSLNKRIDEVLEGSSYDAYLRYIVLEGIHGWWADQLIDWATCPPLAAHDSILSNLDQTALSGAIQGGDPIDLPVCPYHWASRSHQLLCDFVWPAGLSSSSPRRVSSSAIQSEMIINTLESRK